METMTKEQKKAAIDLAWANYRAASQSIPNRTPFSAFRRCGQWEPGFLERDETLWRNYLATERAILATPEAKAA